MLVLALQFSKGVAGVGIVRTHAHLAHRGSGARSSSCQREAAAIGRLPQNGREDKVDHFDSKGGEPTTFVPRRPTHQCTNWELVRTGSDGMPTID